MQTYLGYITANPTSKPFTPTIYTSHGLKASEVVTAGSTKKFNLTLATGHSANASDLIIMFFESQAAPSAGEIPAYEMPLPARALFSWAPSQGGRVFDKLFWAVSSTAGTYTASALTAWMDIEGGIL